MTRVNSGEPDYVKTGSIVSRDCIPNVKKLAKTSKTQPKPNRHKSPKTKGKQTIAKARKSPFSDYGSEGLKFESSRVHSSG